MTEAPARHLRNQADESPDRPPLTQRDRDRYAYILDAAERMFIQNGRAAVTIRQFSYAIGLAQFTIHKHISCLDHAFAIILTKHLNRILTAISAVKYNEPDLLRRRRAEYFRVTRGLCDIPTPMHFLLLRDRFCLPPDELEPIDRLHHMIGDMLGGGKPEEILAQLDCPTMDLKKIESICALIDGIDRDRRENPEPPPFFADPSEPPPEPPKPQPSPPPMAAPPRPDPMANFSDDMLEELTSGKPKNGHCGSPAPDAPITRLLLLPAPQAKPPP
jgi:AcrR family transcriptional regulator